MSKNENREAKTKNEKQTNFTFIRISKNEKRKQTNFTLLLKKKKTILRIMITCPCNEYPVTPHFYIVKLEFIWVNIFYFYFFLFFALNYR